MTSKYKETWFSVKRNLTALTLQINIRNNLDKYEIHVKK